MLIKLTKQEIDTAIDIASQRQSHNTKNIRDQLVASISPLDANVLGTISEMAVVKMTGYEWNAFEPQFWTTPINDRKADCGPIEVRVNLRKYATNMLLYQPKNPEFRPYVLLVKQEPSTFKVVGWRFGFECAKEGFWKSSWARPCYAIPQDRLYGLQSLENWCISSGYGDWKISSLDRSKRSVA